MSGARPQLAREIPSGALPKGRSPLAHLLHALNQPLTGLQCSLELATSGPRSTEQYVRTLREGLELTERMRLLVEALRELADSQALDTEHSLPCSLSESLCEVVEDLRPVAQSAGIKMEIEISDSLPARADRGVVAALMFRWLECVLSIAAEGTGLRVTAVKEDRYADITVSWTTAARPEHSPFSRPELGLLIVQAGWERLGGEWRQFRRDACEICTARLPLADLFTAR